MMGQREKEEKLRNLMLLKKHIEAATKTTKIRLDILTLATKECVTEQWTLKEELRVR